MKRNSTTKSILSNLHALRQHRYVGDLDASVTLIDFERACQMAKLTERQSEAIYLVYDVRLTQNSAGKQMGVGQNTISELVSDGICAIDEVYEMWAWMDGELTIDDFKDEMEGATC